MGLGKRGGGGLWDVKAGEEKEFKKEGEPQEKKDWQLHDTHTIRLDGAADVRRACRVAGIFVRVEIELWKVEKNSSKVGDGGKISSCYRIRNMHFSFFVFH